MTKAEAKKAARELTMACWWPSKVTGLIQPVWSEIRGELRMLADQKLAWCGDAARSSHGRRTSNPFSMQREVLNSPGNPSPAGAENEKDPMTKRDQWVWMPHPAHFAGRQECQFRLAAYVGGYIVSTVGEWRGDVRENDFLRAGATYETVVFAAFPTGSRCCPWVIDGDGLDENEYSDPGEATRGHLVLCEKWSQKNDKRKETND